MTKQRPTRKTNRQLTFVIAVSVAAAAVVTFWLKKARIDAAQPAVATTNATHESTLEINQAVMVTVDLDYAGKPPAIAEALKDIERRYQPGDGAGRTFAILDAFGEVTPESKLRISMHVSSEKVGAGSLHFRRTGETLWSSRFLPASPDKKPPAFGGKNLMIFVDNGAGKLLTIDGSSNPLSILEATVKELGQPLKEVWADGQEREVTFIYSTCGCPVKVMTRREGDRTRRTKDLPVIFPDDPTVVSVIASLMRW
jgi:hypothetical protein